jgi:hypothetical protein
VHLSEPLGQISTKLKQSLSMVAAEIADSLLELTGISFTFNGSQNSASSIV